MRDVLVVWLERSEASRPELTGAKAANLARSAGAGVPTVPGFVLTTAGVALGVGHPDVDGELRAAWEQLCAGADDPNGGPLVVRSSSTLEDASASSMAGQFTSVLDVVGWAAFIDAVGRVVASGHAVLDARGESRPMAVLVQRQLDAPLGGVLFGLDPVTGDRDHVVVEVVASRPDELVSGTVTADHYVLTRRGRVVERRSAGAAPPLPRRVRRHLAALSARAAAVFGAAQDVEWAVDRAGRLWLLQSRPVTAAAAEQAPRHRGTADLLLGPGPVAETFPAPLRRLEADLWLVPLRDGIVRALRTTGAVGDDAIERSPVVAAVDGWAAVDLALLGLTSGRKTLRQRASPAGILRHLGTAWRVGRLRVALPELGASVVATVDRDLAAIGRLGGLDGDALLRLLGNARTELATVHALEVLTGMLLHGPAQSGRNPGTARVPAPLVALHELRTLRARGLTETEVIAAAPVVLALVPPTLGETIALPATPPGVPAGDGRSVDDLDLRDALRLRARWLQELTVRLVEVLGARLVIAGRLPIVGAARDLSFAELTAIVGGGPVPSDLADRGMRPAGPPLPPTFRLDAAGSVRPARQGRTASASGLAAGGGRGAGVVRHRLVGPARAGTVLVTRHLEPQLAGVLPGLAGLVAETGSALSHLAILAREAGVPTVVGVADAVHRFPPGARVLVDGGTGDVELLDAEPGRPDAGSGGPVALAGRS